MILNSEVCYIILLRSVKILCLLHMTILMKGNQILSGLSTKQYTEVIKILESAILSTDLALYFKYVIILRA